MLFTWCDFEKAKVDAGRTDVSELIKQIGARKISAKNASKMASSPSVSSPTSSTVAPDDALPLDLAQQVHAESAGQVRKRPQAVEEKIS